MTRKITSDYSVGSTHGYHAHEIVEAIGVFGSNIWEAADKLLSEIESKDRFDGQRFAALVFDQLVGLINALDVDCPEWAWEEECEKEIRSRVSGKAAPAGVVERTLWTLTNQLQQDRENKMSPEAVSTIRALHEFGGAILSAAGNCIDGHEGVDADVCWRTVAYAALELAEPLIYADMPLIYADMSKDQIDKACNDRERAVQKVADAINSGEDDVGGMELALQALDEWLTHAEHLSTNTDGAAEQASPPPTTTATN